MSAWSEWRCGAITEEEYKVLYKTEGGNDMGDDGDESVDGKETE